ncbi:ParB/RepB/Spo0J family partition protein [Deinococcus daejeonensis]|uniref:Chromosome partitioning protein ParB n=1 Tax=Deinococcus daejeonensis TaxID=1007098 RepID=A0ABQ2JCA8_9DEIO|nr:ParB N-terminal domain-containing protein [Deinococcus daejeonensis]GGN42907.1 chromosome partitioning protein ParB [Deinococcus daejeonensis]
MSREDLLGGLSAVATQGQVRQISHEQLHRAAWQPRRSFPRDSLLALARSVRREGVRQNLIVRPSPQQPGRYEIIAGERRWRASAPDLAATLQLSVDEERGLTGPPPRTLPCLILTLDDQDARRLSAVENLQREDLDAIDEALYRLLLIQDVLGSGPHADPDDASTLAQTLGRRLHAIRNHPEQHGDERARLETLFASLGTMTWESFVTNNLPLLQLPQDLLDAVREGRMAGRSALLIHRQTDPALRQALLAASETGASFQELRRLVDDQQGKRWKGLAADVRQNLGTRTLERLDDQRRARVMRLLEQLQDELQGSRS